MKSDHAGECPSRQRHGTNGPRTRGGNEMSQKDQGTDFTSFDLERVPISPPQGPRNCPTRVQRGSCARKKPSLEGGI